MGFVPSPQYPFGTVCVQGRQEIRKAVSATCSHVEFLNVFHCLFMFFFVQGCETGLCVDSLRPFVWIDVLFGLMSFSLDCFGGGSRAAEDLLTVAPANPAQWAPLLV